MDDETVEVSAETLRDLLAAYQTMTGNGPASHLTLNEAMGLILSYYPALIRMAADHLEEEPVMVIRNSIHEVLDQPDLSAS